MSSTLSFRALSVSLVLAAACSDDSTSSSETGGTDPSSGSAGDSDGDGVVDSTGGSDDAPAESSTGSLDDTSSSGPSVDESGSTAAESTDPGTVGECGDGVVEGDEECDDGPDNREAGMCKPDCTIAYCGDGIVGPGEACDDGDGVNWNGCTNACALPTCGDDLLSTGEECDEGAGNADTGACLTTCMEASCGDGLVWGGMEECDDANAIETDGCLSSCEAAGCGDSIVWAGVETCDDGNGNNTDACPQTCLDATCGDGYVWVGNEQCDDGNLSDDDGCLADCTPAACGDGFVWVGMETCDDQNEQDDDACPGTCIDAFCGDGFLWAGVEECDDGNLSDTDDCPGSCVPAFCGDGFVEAGVETCDDGNQVDTDACPTTCAPAFCGDGFVQAGVEECDDDNGTPGDGCENDCTITPDPCGPPGQIIYVDADATGANDGTSWADAYTSVTLALQGAGSNDELWIAEGVYFGIVANAPVATLEDCVDLRGGFVGTETAVDQRPEPLAPTIFDGDFANDDAAMLFADNAFHVVAATSVSNVLFDGIIITGGRATGVAQNGRGAGFYVSNSGPLTLLDTTMTGNVATTGGGLYAEDSTVTLQDPTFDGNTGRGASVFGGTVSFTGSSFTDNSGGAVLATESANVSVSSSTFAGNGNVSVGGGIACVEAVCAVSDSVFSNNSATSQGGGMYLEGEVEATVTNTSFTTNTAVYGGAFHANDHATAHLEDVTFTGNSAVQDGGAFYDGGGGIGAHTFDQVTFMGNTAGPGSADHGGAVYIYATFGWGPIPTVTMTNTHFENNAATGGDGGAMYLGLVGLVFDDGAFIDNTAVDDGGAVYFDGVGTLGPSVSFRNSRFFGNDASSDGGAIYALPGTTQYLNLDSCVFSSNAAVLDGGAVWTSARARIRNSGFYANTAGSDGGGVRVQSQTGSPIIRSVSFYQNVAGTLGGGIDVTGSPGNGSVRNTVFWGNSSDMDGEALVSIAFTCSEEFLAIDATNLISVADPFALGPSGELFLDQASICVDNGDDAAATADYGAIGLSWQALTTSAGGELDVTPVDMGVHYSP